MSDQNAVIWGDLFRSSSFSLKILPCYYKLGLKHFRLIQQQYLEPLSFSCGMGISSNKHAEHFIFFIFFFHIQRLHSFLSRKNMDQQLTCSRRRWLHSSVGCCIATASQGQGFKPVQALNVFKLLYAIAFTTSFNF